MAAGSGVEKVSMDLSWIFMRTVSFETDDGSRYTRSAEYSARARHEVGDMRAVVSAWTRQGWALKAFTCAVQQSRVPSHLSLDASRRILWSRPFSLGRHTGGIRDIYSILVSTGIDSGLSEQLRSSWLPTQVGMLHCRLASIARHISLATARRSFVPQRTMSTIQALQIQSQGGPEVVQVRCIPAPTLSGSGQVIVRNEYAGVNMIDTYHFGGLYPLKCPIVIGQESAGVVEAVDADVTSVAVGDRVVQYGGGSYTEKQLLNAERVIKLPESISTKTAAAAYLQGLTALTLLKEAHPVKQGDWILVTAAAGGVGLLLCQMGKAFGANVIAVTSTEEKCQLAKQHGAIHALRYNKQDPAQYIAAIKHITQDHGVDAILDGVGADTWESNFEIAARKATIVTFGNASGPVPAFAPLKLASKNLKVVRPTLFNYVTTREERERYSQELFDLIQQGNVKINVHEEYPFTTEDMRRAFADIKSRKTTGKLVVKM